MIGPILIVDDDPEYVDIFETALRAAGYSTMIASTPDEARAQLAIARPSLALIDYQPDPSLERGLQLLLEQCVRSRVQPILMTNYDCAAIPESLQALARSACFIKSLCTQSAIVDLIREVLASARPSR